MNQIENYEIVPVGRSKDLSNQVFGDYIALYRTKVPENSNSKQAYWLCQCAKCKKYLVKNAYVLTKGVNECDCNSDLTNKKFSRWTVQFLTEKRTKNRGKIWHCKCDCGNEKDVPAETLLKGESKSCGCLQKEIIAEVARSQRIDLTGQRFGKLIALFPKYSGQKNQHTIWHCKCDCGNECDIDMGNLRQGFSQSCGCTNSRNEEKIIKMLSKNDLSFIYQYRFDDLKTKEFDFYINNEYIIEYDGQQHFDIVAGWGDKEKFTRTRLSDKEKNQYCFDNNIPLIRIPYNAEYTIEDLKLETTRFLLTPENEQEYYNRK